ncbi:uncharacterized protein LOC113341889 [Papaver somniferum]|uniref:uncharacterized protein LOC113341889 n=1 Tax=Papaver somniferum TaxID=3469 RepID=UPI000E6FC019|nr:uncharacterized protein LOC113341889 [Papaver somniferum]
MEEGFSRGEKRELYHNIDLYVFQLNRKDLIQRNRKRKVPISHRWVFGSLTLVGKSQIYISSVVSFHLQWASLYLHVNWCCVCTCKSKRRKKVISCIAENSAHGELKMIQFHIIEECNQNLSRMIYLVKEIFAESTSVLWCLYQMQLKKVYKVN